MSASILLFSGWLTALKFSFTFFAQFAGGIDQGIKFLLMALFNFKFYSV
jgi:hypothetical protein